MRRVKKLLVVSLVAAACSSLGGAAEVAHGGPAGPTRLATDPTMDGPPSQDLTFLDVARTGKDLEIRIGVEGILPVVKGADLAGVEWLFEVRGKTYLAEAFARAGKPGFILFRIKGDTFQQIAQLEGTYDEADGFIRILVPLKDIGARPGTVISGAGPKGTEDVDVHVHLGATTEYTDYMATTKDFRIPKR